MSKTKKGKDWNHHLVIYELSQGQHLDPLVFSSSRSLAQSLQSQRVKFQVDLKTTKMVRIHYYRSDMPKERSDLELSCHLIGLSGVPLLTYLGAPAAAAAAWQKALVPAGYVVGDVAASGATVAGVCANNIMFHGYLVIECTNGVFISMEKDNEAVVVRIGKSVDQADIAKFKRGETDDVKARDNPIRICDQEATGESIENLFSWILNTQVQKKYDTLTSNCKHLCFETVKKYGTQPNQLPSWLMLSAPEWLKPSTEGKEKGL